MHDQRRQQGLVGEDDASYYATEEIHKFPW